MSRKEFSKQSPESLTQLSNWLEECVSRYRKLVDSLPDKGRSYDMPYEKALKIAVHNLRLHLRGAEEVVEELLSPFGAEAKKAAESVDDNAIEKSVTNAEVQRAQEKVKRKRKSRE